MLLNVLLARRLLFVGGKGGVGKTTIAAALGIAAADRGRRCLIVSTDPAHSLGDALAARLGSDVTRLADRLWGLEIDPDEQAERHLAGVKLQMKGLVHPRLHAEIDRQLDLARLAPGTIEAALLERMAELMAEAGARYDLVVFDTAPTGHTLRLLALPEIMSAWTEGLLRQRERSSKLSAMLRRFSGGPSGDDLSLVGEPPAPEEGTPAARITEILRVRQQKLRRARDLLLDAEATAFLLVMNPDRLSILESGRALASLERAKVPVSAIVVNRVLPADADGEFLAARREQEEPYRREIEREFARLPRVELPLMAHDVHGLEALRRIGAMLAG